MVSAATVGRCFLDPALEAQAHNQEQALLIFNPSPEADSAVELLRALQAASSQRSRRPLLDLARQLRGIATANSRERGEERAIARDADRLVRDLRDLELNGAGEAVLAAKGIARAARGPLRLLIAADTVDRPVIDALRELDQLTSRASTLQVLSPTVRHELGERAFALLRELVERRDPERGPGSQNHRGEVDGTSQG